MRPSQKFRRWLLKVRIVLWLILSIPLILLSMPNSGPWPLALYGVFVIVYGEAFGILLMSKGFSEERSFIDRHEIRDHGLTKEKFYFQAYMSALDIYEMKLLFPFWETNKPKITEEKSNGVTA